jgi:hypothetical protein
MMNSGFITTVPRHTARESLDYVSAMFPGSVISPFGDIAWPVRSPDLSGPDYVLLGTLEAKALKNICLELEELKVYIKGEISATDNSLLQADVVKFPSRLQECTACRGDTYETQFLKLNGVYLKKFFYKYSVIFIPYIQLSSSKQRSQSVYSVSHCRNV